MSQSSKNWTLQTYSLLQPREKVLADVGERDKAYHDLSQMRGWEFLKEDILSLIANLDDVVKLENAHSIEEFGFMVLARDLAKTYLKHIIRMVEDARDYIEQQSDER